jgi:hypothetical protein
LEDKLKGRWYAQMRGVPVPKLYFAGPNFETLDFSVLPKSYVMKTNHWSGVEAVRVVKDGVDMLSGHPFTPSKHLFKNILRKVGAVDDLLCVRRGDEAQDPRSIKLLTSIVLSINLLTSVNLTLAAQMQELQESFFRRVGIGICMSGASND